MYRTQMDLINKFERETNNTVRDFNDIFKGSPIINSNNNVTVSIDELSLCGMRVLRLSDGTQIENNLNFAFSSINKDTLRSVVYLYTIGDECFKSKRDIKNKYTKLSYFQIEKSIDLGITIKKYGGIKVERRVFNEKNN